MGGDFIGRDGKGRFQTRASRGLRSWDDPANQEEFLNHLSATANVARSAEAAGLFVAGAYRLRQRDPQFRERWHLALCDGVARVEALLIEGAAALAEVPRTPDGEIDRLALKLYNPERALVALKVHGPTARGEASAPRRPFPLSSEALREIILVRIAEAQVHLGVFVAPTALPAPTAPTAAGDPRGAHEAGGHGTDAEGAAAAPDAIVATNEADETDGQGGRDGRG